MNFGKLEAILTLSHFCSSESEAVRTRVSNFHTIYERRGCGAKAASVLYMVFDDFRPDLPFYGQPFVHAPHLTKQV